MPGGDNIVVFLMLICCASKINNLNSTWLWQPLVIVHISWWSGRNLQIKKLEKLINQHQRANSTKDTHARRCIINIWLLITTKARTNWEHLKNKQSYLVVRYFQVFRRNKKYILRLQVGMDEAQIMHDCTMKMSVCI